MKLRLLMSHRRKNSVRDKVLGKNWIYSEKHTLQIEYGPSQRVSEVWGKWLVFADWVNFIG